MAAHASVQFDVRPQVGSIGDVVKVAVPNARPIWGILEMKL